MPCLEELKPLVGAHVIKRITVNERGCWCVKGDPSSNGYQRIWWRGARYSAHRLIYELMTGKDIREKVLDHLCENITCCNPDHLDPVTQKVNVRRIRRRRKKV